MKKFFTSVLLLSVVMSVFAVSYTNNTYQKLADEYNKKAQLAFDAGEYDLAISVPMTLNAVNNSSAEVTL